MSKCGAGKQNVVFIGSRSERSMQSFRLLFSLRFPFEHLQSYGFIENVNIIKNVQHNWQNWIRIFRGGKST
jgi:hypothetical protein